MKNDVADGRFDYPKYRQMLTGRNPDHCNQEHP